MPAKEDKKKSKRGEGGLRSKGILDATSGETEAPSSEHEDEGGGEGDIPSPHGKKRGAPKDLDVEASKRGKKTLPGGPAPKGVLTAQRPQGGQPSTEL